MKVLSVIAVDDEAPALRRICKMIEEHPKLQLVASARNSVDAIRGIKQINPNLLLLDIQLKDATAFDVLSELKENFTGKIIFITAYDQYAVKAFEFEAVDYLLKPYTKDRFDSAIARVLIKKDTIDINKLIKLLTSEKSKNNKMLIIPEGVKNYFINKDSLLYIYSEGYYANFVLENDKKLVRISLKKLEQLLPENFVRINKSTIINQYHISELVSNRSSTKIVMPNGEDFQVSDTYLEAFKTFINRTKNN